MFRYPDEDALLRDLLGSDLGRRALRFASPDTVRRVVLEGLAGYRTSNGGYRLDNAFATSSEAQMFAHLLRRMGATDLIIQATDGLILAGPTGERMINHYNFYTAFHTAEEYRLVAGGRTIGSLPISFPVIPGTLLIFGGRR